MPVENTVAPVTVTRTNKAGQSYTWDFEYKKLKKKNSNDPDRYSFVPVAINDKLPGRTAEDFMNFMGDDAAPFLVAKLRTASTIVMKYSIEEATPKNEKGEAIGAPDIEVVRAKFQANASDISARGETLKSLVDELGDLQDELIALSTNSELPALEKVTKIQEIGKRMQLIQATIEEKKAKHQNDDE